MRFRFKVDYIIVVSIVVLAIMLISVCTPNGKSVTITSKNWVCTASDQFGIEARCVQYQYVPNKGEVK